MRPLTPTARAMNATLPHDTPPGVDVSVSMERANVLGALAFPAAVLLVVIPFALVWGWRELGDGFATVFRPWHFVPGLVVLVVVHEALHGLGFLLFGRAPREAVHFGFDRKTLTPFAGCRVPLTAAAYRAAVLLPALVLGVIPAAWAVAEGNAWLALTGAFMLGAAGGDLLVVWVIRRVPGTARVVDHPSRVGCYLVDGAEAPRRG